MKVKFVPQNLEFEIKPGQSVLHVAQDHGIYVKSVCKGVPSCAECRVRIVEGDHNVMPPGSEELSLIGTGHFIDRRRLSCQLKCFGDITVDMTEQIEKQKNLTSDHKLKSKVSIKDDRVEDQHAIRAESSHPVPDHLAGQTAESIKDLDKAPRGSGREETDDDGDDLDDEIEESGSDHPGQGAHAQGGRGPQGGGPGEGGKRRRRRRRGRRGGGGNGGGQSGPRPSGNA